jgi:hypothetical protein
MYELDDSGKYSDLCDFDATTRLHRSASLHVARAKADGNTTDNGDGEWDATPPEFLPAVFSSRKKEQMKKKQKQRRATKGTTSATASSPSASSSASAPNKRQKRACGSGWRVSVSCASLPLPDGGDFQ